jgi:hypothetical protein
MYSGSGFPYHPSHGVHGSPPRSPSSVTTTTITPPVAASVPLAFHCYVFISSEVWSVGHDAKGGLGMGVAGEADEFALHSAEHALFTQIRLIALRICVLRCVADCNGRLHASVFAPGR